MAATSTDVGEAAGGDGQLNDLTDQNETNYAYDVLGQLTKDESATIEEISWTANGKVKEIKRSSGSTQPDLEFTYNSSGERIGKTVKLKNAAGYLMYPIDWEYYYYVHDASGNPMAIYQSKFTESNSLQLSRGLYAKEFPIYGQSRLGIYTPKSNSPHGKLTHTLTNYSNGSTHSLHNAIQPQNIAKTIYFGEKSYEISDYLGNITAVLSDKGLYLDNDTMQKVALSSSQDYYPFGMQMPGRSFSSENYRYGFQGQEMDNEIKGNGNSINFKYRMYDPRIGRFFAVDPLAPDYPWYTPYQFAGNTPIQAKDLEGAEPEFVIKEMAKKGMRATELEVA
ncbi:MAG: RHS repeat-associated core domain-containing protein, partial [Flavobacteriales bacterium]|nr:RHS repeat-associated core domain-containing protein [Flavobacteriales bacterium]